jgi:dTDP-4-amino-4,6-dideoxygalactose transaminase
MPRFKVNVTKSIGFVATVEAKSAKDAWDIVADVDPDEFDVSVHFETDAVLDDGRGRDITVEISRPEDVGFDVHYPPLEVQK